MAHPDFTKLTEADILAMLATVNTNTIIGDTLPENPDPGSLWFDQTRAKLYTYYDDGDSGQWVSAGGGVQAAIDAAGAFGADANTQITPSTPIVLDQATGDEAALTLDYTTNKATSGNDTGLLINQTDTASPGTSKLLDLQVGGSSKFNVDSVGTATSVYGFQSGRNSTGGVMLGNAYGFYGLGMGSQGRVAWGPASPFASPDLVVLRDAAGTLGQRNGVNAQAFNIYNTYTSATAFERAHIGWNDTADTFVIGTEAGSGGGAVRGIHVEPGGALKLKAATGNQITLGANGSYTWQLTTGQVFGPTGNNVRDLASALIRVKSAYLGTTLDIDQGTLTDDAQAVNITSTWNDAADTFTLIKADVTNTASAADSKLLDLQVGGVSKFSVTSLPKLVGISGYFIGLYGGVTSTLYSLNLFGKLSIGTDVSLSRDAANTLAQRNGVNAQTYNIYNTYTDATNYERGHIGWNDTADTFVIGTEAGGTGANRRTQLGSGVNGVIEVRDYPDNTGMIFSQGGNQKFYMRPNSLLSSASLYYDLGDSGAGRWGTAYTQVLDVDQGTLTDDAQALNITSTWNDAADTFTLVKADVTNTASAADSKLLDLQVGGASKFGVDATGLVTVGGVGVIKSPSNLFFDSTAYFASTAVGTSRVSIGNGVKVGASYAYEFSATTGANGTADLFLNRAAAATLQLGTNDATVATGQTIKAHDVVTGTGAALTLSGGTGSVANGPVFIEAGNSVDVSVQGVNKLTIGGGDSRFRVPVYPSASGVYDLGLKGILEWRNGSFSGDLYAGGSVGIGTATPDANAILDVSSTTKAFLPPRMTTTEKNTVASPAAGMLVYDSTLNKLAVYTGAAWEAITSA